MAEDAVTAEVTEAAAEETPVAEEGVVAEPEGAETTEEEVKEGE